MSFQLFERKVVLLVVEFFTSQILRHQGLFRGPKLNTEFTLMLSLIACSHCESVYYIREVGCSISTVKHNLNNKLLVN